MKIQYKNLAISSFILWINNRILDKGQAFNNISGQFYPIQSNQSNLITYSTPYGQMVSDISITGANIPTGIFINEIFTVKGQSNFSGYNYEKGQAMFGSKPSGPITSNYSVKEFSVGLSVPDIEILVETEQKLRPKIGSQITGIANNQLNYPALYIIPSKGKNVPFAFGGLKETETTIEIISLSDSSFKNDAIKGIFEDCLQEYIPLLNESQASPYNLLGDYKNNIPLNYPELSSGLIGSGHGILIKDVVITDLSRRLYSEAQTFSNDVYFAVAEFELGFPRLT